LSQYPAGGAPPAFLQSFAVKTYMPFAMGITERQWFSWSAQTRGEA